MIPILFSLWKINHLFSCRNCSIRFINGSCWGFIFNLTLFWTSLRKMPFDKKFDWKYLLFKLELDTAWRQWIKILSWGEHLHVNFSMRYTCVFGQQNQCNNSFNNRFRREYLKTHFLSSLNSCNAFVNASQKSRQIKYCPNNNNEKKS